MSLPSSAGALRPQCRKKNGVTKMKAGTVLFTRASFPLTVSLFKILVCQISLLLTGSTEPAKWELQVTPGQGDRKVSFLKSL